MATTRSSDGDGNGGIGGGGKAKNEDGGFAEYEKSRQQRINQNLQKMHNLGILHLSRNLKPPTKPKIKTKTESTRSSSLSSSSSSPPRRSFRLKMRPTVSYAKMNTPKSKLIMDVKPEVYTEHHEKMLADHIQTWKFVMDGEMNPTCYAYAGNRCHQCRRKFAGVHSNCCKCKTGQRPYCGSCLFKRYGENIVEASVNPDWVCPFCRDICNCSYCRRAKGWEPVGDFYQKALNLGFKSVAHYLIHTHGPHRKKDDRDNEASKDLLHDDSKHVLIQKNIKRRDCDQHCEGGDDDLVPRSDTCSS